MIEIKDTEKTYHQCNSCGSENKVKKIYFVASDSGSGQSIKLCVDCLRGLSKLIKVTLVKTKLGMICNEEFGIIRK